MCSSSFTSLIIQKFNFIHYLMSYQELIKNQEQNQNQQHFFQFIMGTKSESKLFSSLEPELKQNQKAFFKLVLKL